VVRARDQAGNIDSNVAQVSAATGADTTAPVFAGLTSATAASSSSATLAWSAATDDVTPAAQLVYLVYYSTTAGGQNFAMPSVTTTAGATSVTVGGLSPSTTYHFVVRARDATGNIDGNVLQRSATLPGTTVSFAGAVQPIFAANCAGAGCHRAQMPAEGLNLSTAAASYAGLVNVASAQCPTNKRVLPGSSATSYLARKVAGAGPCFFGTKMPKTGSITAAERTTIITWIDEGALNN
jgi:hypothetical protein